MNVEILEVVKADKKAVDLTEAKLPHTFYCLTSTATGARSNITDILENEPYELPVLPFRW